MGRWGGGVRWKARNRLDGGAIFSTGWDGTGELGGKARRKKEPVKYLVRFGDRYPSRGGEALLPVGTKGWIVTGILCQLGLNCIEKGAVSSQQSKTYS